MVALNGSATCAQDVLAVTETAKLNGLIHDLVARKRLSKLVQTLNAQKLSESSDIRETAEAALTRLGFVDPD